MHASAGFISGDMGPLSMLFFCSLLLLTSPPSSSAATPDRNLQVEQLLSQLNKPYVKSINSPDGDIIDCVDIHHQPALDHPLLRNHTIQLVPSSYPHGMNASGGREAGERTQTWREKESCPVGAVPIIRTKREDVLRASSVKAYGKKTYVPVHLDQNLIPPVFDDSANHEYAVGAVRGGRFFGGRSFFNVWNPYVEANEMTLSQMWISAGVGANLNTIEAGWQVYPALNGDRLTRFFIYWTSDNYGLTGCYNLKCPGFVQVDHRFPLGGPIRPISAYGGAQYDIGIDIWKDPRTGNWYLQVDNVVVGYWPSSLFTIMNDAASGVDWGGEVFNLRNGGRHTTTQMGSGHFPEEGGNRAAYIRNLQLVDASHALIPAKNVAAVVAQRTNCYRFTSHYNNVYENYIYFGGPGRNPNCP